MHNKPHTKAAKLKMSIAKRGVPLTKKRRQFRIENGVRYFVCPTCNRELPEGSFYPNKKTWCGIGSQCRNCHIRGSIKTRSETNTRRLKRESMRRCRIKNPEKYRARERVAARKRPKDRRYYARQMVNLAVKAGYLKRPSTCSECGRAAKITAHHPDYDLPLSVVWLCYECHGNK
jgi:hypothetical protein